MEVRVDISSESCSLNWKPTVVIILALFEESRLGVSEENRSLINELLDVLMSTSKSGKKASLFFSIECYVLHKLTNPKSHLSDRRLHLHSV